MSAAAGALNVVLALSVLLFATTTRAADGTGVFTDASAVSLFPNPDDNTQGATLADVDLDGDLDLVKTAQVVVTGRPASGRRCPPVHQRDALSQPPA